MTKSELIARLAQRYPQLVAKDAEYAVKMILDAMTQALLSGNRIEIRGFGSFGLNYRPPRIGRNPKSGEKVQVPEKYVPHFKAGKELRERVDRADADATLVMPRPRLKPQSPAPQPQSPAPQPQSPASQPQGQTTSAQPQPAPAPRPVAPADDPDATLVMPPRPGRAANN